METDETKVTWVTCPECGARIGIVVSVGRGAVEGSRPLQAPQAQDLPSQPVLSGSLQERLVSSGIEVALLDIQESGDMTVVRPKRFLGDLWGRVNEVMRSVGGVWVREGRESRWEIRNEVP